MPADIFTGNAVDHLFGLISCTVLIRRIIANGFWLGVLVRANVCDGFLMAFAYALATDCKRMFPRAMYLETDLQSYKMELVP